MRFNFLDLIEVRFTHTALTLFVKRSLSSIYSNKGYKTTKLYMS